MFAVKPIAKILAMRHAQSMIRKSGNRFSEKIMLHQNARAQIAST
jgi:hypothetical protein